MVDFTVKNQDLINFLTKATARGVISVSKTEKVSATFFKRFYMEAIGNTLEIKALDSQGGTMWGWHKLRGVVVDDPGKFAITDTDLLLDLLKSIEGKRKVNVVYEEDQPFTITTADEGPFKGFELREWVTMTPKEIKEYQKNVIAFINVHSFIEGMPVITDPKSGKIQEYSTISTIEKKSLNSVVSQSIKLTRDQDIRVTMDKEGNITFLSGDENALIKSKDILYKITENPFDFDQKFGNLQPVVPHLYNEITIYMRKASDGKLKWWMRSQNEQIELNFVTGAI